MRFEESEAASVTVMKVVDSRIAADGVAAFRSGIADKMSAGARAIVLDLENVTFIDSSGLGALVSVLKALGSEGSIALCGVHGAVAAAFRLSRMDRVFRLYANSTEAVAALTPACSKS